MSKPNLPLAFSGASIPFRAGDVLIVLSCVLPGRSYRVSVQYPSTGFEIPGLSVNRRDEREARTAARNIATVFLTGLRVVDALDALGVIA